MPPRYDLLAIDLDGTLLGAGATLSDANIDAVRRARAAGLRVVVCTGRGLVECRQYLERLGQTDPVIVAGGAITADPVTGRTISRVAMDRSLVEAVSSILIDSGHAALVFKDAHEVGYDYLVLTGGGMVRPDPVTVWWFENMGVRVRYADTLADDGDPGHTIRVGMCAGAAESAALASEVRERLGERVMMHAFKAVVWADARGDARGNGERVIHIFEAFDPRAGKWPALERLAAGMEIEPGRIAAIGDEINDVGMIRGAGLGVAMGNAVEAVREVADRVTLDHCEDGAALAIGRILDGEW